MALPRPLPIPRPAFPAAPNMVPRLAGSTSLAGGPPLPPRAYASPLPGGQTAEARPAHLLAALPSLGAVARVNPPSLPGLPSPSPGDRAGAAAAAASASRPGALAVELRTSLQPEEATHSLQALVTKKAGCFGHVVWLPAACSFLVDDCLLCPLCAGAATWY
jgi:hypothetical protein